MPAFVANFFSWMNVGLPAFLFVITLVVFVHELGHFLVARWCGVTVETFSIGFGREIVGFTDRKGTRWKLSWIRAKACCTSNQCTSVHWLRRPDPLPISSWLSLFSPASI